MKTALRGNTNVITFNETVLFVLVTLLDSTLFYYFMDDHQEFVFNLEMLRTIFIQIILLKFLFPIYLIVSSKYNLPELWADSSQRKQKFSMTPPSFVARQVVRKYQVDPLTWDGLDANKVRKRPKRMGVRFKNDHIVTFHPDLAEDFMPPVLD